MVKNLPDKSSFWVTKHSCISQEYSHPESRLHFKESLEAKKPGNNVQIHWIQVEVIRSLPGNVLKRICHDYLSFLPFLCPECGQDGWRQISHLWLHSDLGMEETHGGAWVPNTMETSQPWIIFFPGYKSFRDPTTASLKPTSAPSGPWWSFQTGTRLPVITSGRKEKPKLKACERPLCARDPAACHKPDMMYRNNKAPWITH